MSRDMMSPTTQRRISFLIAAFIFFVDIFPICHGDVGTAAQYSPPYVPTECYGNDPSQFPSSNLFGSAGEGIWDNGAACGRQYLVRCISAAEPGTCIPDRTIQIKIIDYAPNSVSQPTVAGATIVLSNTAFEAIANSSAKSVNVEFRQSSTYSGSSSPEPLSLHTNKNKK